MSIIDLATLAHVTGGALSNQSALPALPRPTLPQLPNLPKPQPSIPLGPFYPDPPVRKDIA